MVPISDWVIAALAATPPMPGFAPPPPEYQTRSWISAYCTGPPTRGAPPPSRWPPPPRRNEHGHRAGIARAGHTEPGLIVLAVGRVRNYPVAGAIRQVQVKLIAAGAADRIGGQCIARRSIGQIDRARIDSDPVMTEAPSTVSVPALVTLPLAVPPISARVAPALFFSSYLFCS